MVARGMQARYLYCSALPLHLPLSSVHQAQAHCPARYTILLTPEGSWKYPLFQIPSVLPVCIIAQ